MDEDYAILLGDDFANNDLPELKDIQFLGSSRHRKCSKCKKGGDEPVTPVTQVATDVTEMEVFEEQKEVMDIYSLLDADRMRLLLREFDNNISDANRFNYVINQIWRIRAVFRQNKNDEIMIRQ
jgi:hypothetical protein